MNDELARRLCAAYKSARHGIGMDYALKRTKNEKIGQYWLHLADKVDRDVADSMEKMVMSEEE